ncbi:uncharacterized protein LOC123294258 [Chrysoperla carnea]|uniref:uncharacterized protein LOC123294258 n=1 Tax=Chrysoperla carnea TaxID=189513 RepID=UPI001D06CA91|nr:uncharacterized protein LOC123294258 [Chrysoperla carnea]
MSNVLTYGYFYGVWLLNRLFCVQFYANLVRRIRAMTDFKVVRVKQGELRGRAEYNFNGEKFYSYKGIPYAAPPVGKLRFKAPRPPHSWEGVRDALEEGSPCRSRDFINITQFVGSEDCLYLNVYASEKPDNDKKPVMVFVHGGGFMTGSSTSDFYGPQFLLTEDIVLVTLNYRLGAFGFLAFENPSIECPGNQGMKDVLQALKWVKENISVFHGDPDNVTLFGESAGAAIVHYLTFAPEAWDYFHKIICQSGSANADWAYDRSRPHELAKELGFVSDNDQEVYEFLVSVPEEEIAEAQEKLITYEDLREGITAVWCPVIEVLCDNEPNLIVEHPFTTMAKGNYYDCPSIFGYNTDEGLLFLSAHGPTGLFLNPEFNDPEVTVPRSMHLVRGSDESKKLGEIIKKFYYGQSIPSIINIVPFIKIMTDIVFSVAIHYAVRRNAENLTSPVYYYRFNVDSPLSLIKKFFQIKYPGVAHGDDLAYLFNNVLTPLKLDKQSLEYKTMYRFVKMWTQFARTSNPNVEDDPLINIDWKPSNDNDTFCLHLDEELSYGVNPDLQRIKFWQNLVDTHLEKFKAYVKRENSTIQSKSQLRMSTLGNIGRKLRKLSLDSAQEEQSQVETGEASKRQGKLKGKKNLDIYENEFYSFEGIPYGKPPIGDLRFKPPLPAEPWEGVFDGTIGTKVCPSYLNVLSYPDLVDEDCLRVNVYTPLGNESQEKLPVMVWIHGGGFFSGSGNSDIYGPDYLMAKNVVLVTINYRLGYLGFLSLKDPTCEVTGNAGLKDQTQALLWVQKNISTFGGDPNNVTIFGQSAGSASISYHILSPLSKGLFHKAILQSGVVLNPWARQARQDYEFIRLMGCTSTDDKEILEFVQNQKLEDILNAQTASFPLEVQSCGEICEISPNVEPNIPSAFLPDTPENILREGRFNDVPIMIGVTDTEGLLMDMHFFIEFKKYQFDNDVLIPRGLQEKLKSKEEIVKTVKKIKEFYKITDIKSMTDYWTDVLFAHQSQVFATEFSRKASNPVYNYLFRISVDDFKFSCKLFNWDVYEGANHGDDLPYLFKSALGPFVTPNTPEAAGIHIMTTLWTNFAKTGNPNPATSDPHINVEWKPFTPNDENYLEIDLKPQPKKSLLKERIQFWNNLYKQ